MDMGFSEILKGLESELLIKSKFMEKISNMKELDQPIAKILENSGNFDNLEDKGNNLEPNSKYEIDGDIYETDDGGKIYKKNGELLPNITYTRNGYTWTTDELGRPATGEGTPVSTPDNERDERAQTEAGGEDRQEGDDGGHLIARILGGSSGNENIVPMRSTINRGDYKRAENEIAEAIKQGKEVQDSIKIEYDGDSTRPVKIERTYVIDGEKNVLKVDNVEGSTDLLENIEDSISVEDMDSLKNEIEDMKNDGCDVSVTSVLKKYDKDGNLESVCVGIRNETTGEKIYKTYEPGKEG